MEHRHLVRLIKDQGYGIVVSNAGKMKIYSPNGSYVITIPSTPAQNGKTGANTIANLRRAGVNIPRK